MPNKILCILSILLLSSAGWSQTFGLGEPPGESRPYEGFFVGTSLGYGSLAHESFLKNPSFSSFGLGLGYDYYLLPNIGIGLSAKASYNHQAVDGESVGGTYTGLDLNPINLRLVFSFLSIGLAFEYHLLPSYQVSKLNSAGEKIEWSKGTGYSVGLVFPWKFLGGNFGVTYHLQSYKKQEIGSLGSDIEDLNLNHFLLQLEFRDLFASDMSTF